MSGQEILERLAGFRFSVHACLTCGITHDVDYDALKAEIEMIERLHPDWSEHADNVLGDMKWSGHERLSLYESFLRPRPKPSKYRPLDDQWEGS